MRPILLLGALVATWLMVLQSGHADAERSPMPALVSGQSNAMYLAPYLPQGAYELVAEGGMSIRAWEPTADVGQRFRAALAAHTYRVIVWWQGEADWEMSAEDYAQRLVRLLLQAHTASPGLRAMLVEMSTFEAVPPHIREAQRWLARESTWKDYVALIDTADLPPHGVHFDDRYYAVIAQRIQSCYFADCWDRQ